MSGSCRPAERKHASSNRATAAAARCGSARLHDFPFSPTRSQVAPQAGRDKHTSVCLCWHPYSRIKKDSADQRADPLLGDGLGISKLKLSMRAIAASSRGSSSANCAVASTRARLPCFAAAGLGQTPCACPQRQRYVGPGLVAASRNFGDHRTACSD